MVFVTRDPTPAVVPGVLPRVARSERFASQKLCTNAKKKKLQEVVDGSCKQLGAPKRQDCHVTHLQTSEKSGQQAIASCVMTRKPMVNLVGFQPSTQPEL